MSGFKVEVIGKDKAAATFKFISDSLKPDKRRALCVNLAVLALAEEASYFRSATSPTGVPWAPLSQTTIMRRRRGGNRPLQDTGILRLSVSAGAGPIPPAESQSATTLGGTPTGGVRQVSADGFVIGTRLTYAGMHQYGRGRRKAMVRGHVRRQRSRSTRRSRTTGASTGVAFVSAHETTLPSVPARPFVGYSTRLIGRMTHYASDFITKAGKA